MKMYQLSSGLQKLLSNTKTTKFWTRLSYIVLGISSTVWFLARVIPKPSRATYPCMQATVPFMSGFVIYLLSITGTAFAYKKFRHKLANAKYLAAASFLVVAFVMIVVANASTQQKANAVNFVSNNHFQANNPIGTASGLKPGRVVWVWDKNATNENFTPANNQSNWWAKQTNGLEVEKMLGKALMKYSDKNSTAESWDAMFKYFNQQHGKGNVGYTSGEKIYIKVNITNSANGMKKTQNFNRMDVTPELTLSLLKQLVEVVGIAQSDIYLGDPFRNFHNLYWDMCHSVYPNVVYCDGLGIEGRHQTVPTTEHVMVFSDKQYEYRIPQEYVNASYIINMPCLKTHNEGAITLGAKNHQGSVLQDGGRSDNQYMISMHYSLPANSEGYGKYRHVVDYLGHKDVGGKTLVTIIDGIWAGRSWEGFVEKWKMAPFNNDYPSSLFISQDRVAVDAVCFDFLLEEYKNKPADQKYPYIDGCDDFLYQAADSTYWPEGIKYDPEGDGTTLKSMGVYEHWNNPAEMKYSRNLGTGNGIELVKVNLNTDPFTPSNSGIASAKVNKIFVDSFDVKWFGTDKGISRFDGENWVTYDKSNYLRNNVVNDIVYEKTSSGNEIWVATNGGLSVMSYNVDGVTAATTYYVGGPESEMISDTVTAVGVDKNHNRWIATPRGVTTFGNNGWHSTQKYIGESPLDIMDWNGLIVNSIGSYNNDTSVYMGTSGQGVVRMAYDEVDGFTGASAMSSIWSGLWSDTVHSVTIYDTIQWYGTNLGAFEHFGPSTKNYWDYYLTPDDTIINPVVKDIEKDNSGNIWIGTEKGLNIVTSNGVLKYQSGVQSSNIIAQTSSSMATLSWTNGNGFVGSMLDENVNDIQKDISGIIWIASNSGVEQYKTVPGVPKGEETKRVVFVTKTASGTIVPTNGKTYKGDPEFKKGDAIGDWFCVYNGTENSVDVNTLNASSTYRAAVFDYYGLPGHEVYTPATGTNNPITFTTNPVGKEEFGNSMVKAFPVPFNNYLMIRLNVDSNKTYMATICNLDGKIFKRLNFSGNNLKIETSELARGAYLLKITDGVEEKVLKIIK